MFQAPLRNTPWTIEERLSCRAIVDAARQDIAHVDKETSGSITSRNYTPEELTDRIRLMAAAPKLLEALMKIDANAAESVGWIRRIARTALDIALPRFRIGDRVRSIETNWHGQVVSIEWTNGAEMLKCQYDHPDGSVAEDDTRWFSPDDVRAFPRSG